MVASSPKANQRIFDAELKLKDTGLIAASAAALVNSVAKIVNLGGAEVTAEAIVDVTAIEIASNDEEYDILVQGSNSASFASGVENLAQLNLGAAAVRQGGAQASTVGRYKLPFSNEKAGTVYQYIRVYTVVAGTIATGINYSAFIDTIRNV